MSDPADPQVVATLQNPAGTSAEDVVVYTASSAPRGRTSRRPASSLCESRFDPRGRPRPDALGRHDPSAPVQIGYLDRLLHRGVHEFEVEHRADLGRTFAYATVPTAVPDGQSSGYRDVNGDGDFRLIDITDPAGRRSRCPTWGSRTSVAHSRRPGMRR